MCVLCVFFCVLAYAHVFVLACVPSCCLQEKMMKGNLGKSGSLGSMNSAASRGSIKGSMKAHRSGGSASIRFPQNGTSGGLRQHSECLQDAGILLDA